VDVSSAMMSQNKAFIRQPNGDPLIGRDYGYHLENVRFVDYLEEKAEERGITILDDKMTEVLQDDHGITGLRFAANGVLTADLYLDCSGFRSLLLGQALGEPYFPFKSTLFNDRAVTGGWERTDDPIQPYTTAETMNCGWCWRIDHPDRINRGYVYSSDFISDDEAQREFHQKNPKVEKSWFVKFRTGRYQNSWVKNVVAIGNSSGFVEPLESTSLAVICDESRLLAECLADCDRQPGPNLIASYNHIGARAWDTIRYFLGIHFKFNTRYDTPYWRACREKADLGTAQPLVDYYMENGPSTYGRTALLRINDIFGMEGYLCLLMGQNVPFRKKWQPSAREVQIWNGIRAENRAKALTALNSQESLQAILSPEWKWTPGFFRQ
jgi:tryptophan halogenase